MEADAQPVASALQLKARAADLRTVGTYIGLFDWLVWSIMRRAVLFALFGDHLICVGAVFAPELTILDPDNDPQNGFTVIPCLE